MVFPLPQEYLNTCGQMRCFSRFAWLRVFRAWLEEGRGSLGVGGACPRRGGACLGWAGLAYDGWGLSGDGWGSPMLPFQVFSSFLSSANWLLVREVWRECVPVAAAMDGTERAGRRLEESVFPASLRDRCWRTLIMASFSMILAWRFLILCNETKQSWSKSTWIE